MTLGSLFAIFEPWIWRRLGPVPACLKTGGVLNSRPIGVLFDDTRDPQHRTTAHLCCGGKLEAFPVGTSVVNNDLIVLLRAEPLVLFCKTCYVFFGKEGRNCTSVRCKNVQNGKAKLKTFEGGRVYITDDNAIRITESRVFHLYYPFLLSNLSVILCLLVQCR